MAASNSIRLRRTLRAISSLHRSFSSSATTSAPPISLAIRRALLSAPPAPAPAPWLSRSFRSSSISLWSKKWFAPTRRLVPRVSASGSLSLSLSLSARLSSSPSNIPDEFGPDDMLVEGWDYHHWLFGMDFPGDNKPSPEEMVRTYEETCAKGLGINVAEAKQKIYACSTTNYTGFQAVMSEGESKKFEIIFVLPDSYIDPVNKEYGGDKYINGTIIPRPPPIQYGRNTGRRPHQDNQKSNHQGNPSYNNRGPMQGDGRNYGQASQNYPPQQNYASQNYAPQQNCSPAPQNYPSQQNYGRSPESYPPQQNFGQAPQNHPQQQTYGSASQQRYGHASPQYPQQQSYGSPGQGDSRNYVPQQNFGPPGQGEKRDPVPRDSDLSNGTYTPSYMKDFKPSYMQEFENDFPPKEQAGSQQRNPTPGHGNFIGEVW
ncbi:hypothetical protein AAHE18_06G103000 [Arachis hypogaea]